MVQVMVALERVMLLLVTSTISAGTGVGVTLGVTVAVGVTVVVGDGVRVGVGVTVSVAVLVRVGVRLGEGVLLGEGLARVGVVDAVGVAEATVAVAVGDGVGVAVGVRVLLVDAVAVAVDVGVDVTCCASLTCRGSVQTLAQANSARRHTSSGRAITGRSECHRGVVAVQSRDQTLRHLREQLLDGVPGDPALRRRMGRNARGS